MYNTQVSRFALIESWLPSVWGSDGVRRCGIRRRVHPRVINSSTIPSNGDVNPYGCRLRSEHFPGGGTIAAGDVLVSNFNSSANVQGTGTTIVQLRPRGPLAPPEPPLYFLPAACRD